MGRLAEKGIPKNPGDTGVARVKAPSDTPLGVVGMVLGVVAPVNPIIQPNMVIGVLADSDG